MNAEDHMLSPHLNFIIIFKVVVKLTFNEALVTG